MDICARRFLKKHHRLLQAFVAVLDRHHVFDVQQATGIDIDGAHESIRQQFKKNNYRAD